MAGKQQAREKRGQKDNNHQCIEEIDVGKAMGFFFFFWLNKHLYFTKGNHD